MNARTANHRDCYYSHIVLFEFIIYFIEYIILLILNIYFALYQSLSLSKYHHSKVILRTYSSVNIYKISIYEINFWIIQ